MKITKKSNYKTMGKILHKQNHSYDVTIKKNIGIILVFITIVMFNENAYSFQRFILKYNYQSDSIFQLSEEDIYSYYNRDTFYIYDKNNNFIKKQHLNRSRYNPKHFSVEQVQYKKYLFVSIYAGDATPYRSYLIDLRKNKIIVENQDYQTYLGSSNNNFYHAFEGGTAASERELAIFNSNNELIKSTNYFPEIRDTNALKWFGNKICYYSDVKEKTHLPDSLPNLKEYYHKYVQKYYWSNNKDSAVYEFKKAFIE